MLSIKIIVFKLTVLQNVVQVFAKLPAEDSSKSTKLLSNTLVLYNTNTPYHGFIFSDNDLKVIDMPNTNTVKGDHKKKHNRNRVEEGMGKNKKKLAEVTNQIEYFENAINSNNNKGQQSKKIKQSNSHKITTTTNNKKHTNTLSTKATIATKSYAGMKMTILPMRVENDLKRLTETNEVRRNQTEKDNKSKTNNKRHSVVDKNNGAVVVASANAIPSIGSTKLYQSNTFVNPFGQLASIFGNDQFHLQDYTFFFNAERHTVFQLHTNKFDNNNNNNRKMNFGTKVSHNAVPLAFVESGRLLNAVFGGGPAMVSNSMPITTTTTGTTSYSSSLVQVEEVQLYNATSLRQSRYNPFNPTRILIHGWLGGSTAGVYQTLVPEYLRQGNGNYNVFTVDWGRGAVADYLTASYRVKPVGKVLAKFIDFLQREAGMRFEDLHLIGFSMGAHIAGIAGKHLESGRLPLIYALDPALPFFRYDSFDDRIAITDADYVEVVHTSVGSYGYDRPLGHVDFYVNYGSAQPGCFFNECSHMRAYQIFAESLQMKGALVGQGCDVNLWTDLIRRRRCAMSTGRQMLLGGDPANVTALRGRGGVFYLVTNAQPPYAK
ncbi:uncharacterized protein [Eurosta solidaginis]|uniref:uncharacterized protein n=1 Tax=Eurosta solidaginis TaxID=178769 RepID=UPI0035314C0F